MKEYWVVAVDKQANINDFVGYYLDDKISADIEAKLLNEQETNFNLVYEVWCIPL